MKIKDYIKSLQVLADKYPEAEVVTSSDDEGNSFTPVIFAPSEGRYSFREFTSKDELDGAPINAICLN